MRHSDEKFIGLIKHIYKSANRLCETNLGAVTRAGQHDIDAKRSGRFL